METAPQNQYGKLPKKLDFIKKWSRFSKYNDFIDGVNIIPLKCPLETKFDEHLLESDVFHFGSLFEYSVSVNKPITDIVDLTFTNKYYNPKAENFELHKVSHHKFMIPGKKIPAPPLLENILTKIDEILKNGGAVGVHCTHGINRTGFIICSYLVRKLDWKPDEALEAFKKARGHPVEHKDYIRAILSSKDQDEKKIKGFYSTKKNKVIIYEKKT